MKASSVLTVGLPMGKHRERLAFLLQLPEQMIKDRRREAFGGDNHMIFSGERKGEALDSLDRGDERIVGNVILSYR